MASSNFSISKGATLPTLRLEPINDGRYSTALLNIALQSATATFTMTDINNGKKVVVNQPVDIVEKQDVSCEEIYVLEYKWKERDTRIPGVYKGEFRITFDDNIVYEDKTFPSGTLIVPIQNELFIHVIEGAAKK